MPVMKQNGGLPVLAHVVAENEKADKAKKPPSKKTFYRVMVEFYANGTVKTAITTAEAFLVARKTA
jgi:hypothetical protein